jgi:hypothetical protein
MVLKNPGAGDSIQTLASDFRRHPCEYLNQKSLEHIPAPILLDREMLWQI